MGPSSADALNSIRGSAEDGPNSWGWHCQASFGASLSLSALHLFCDGISWEAVHEAPLLFHRNTCQLSTSKLPPLIVRSLDILNLADALNSTRAGGRPKNGLLCAHFVCEEIFIRTSTS